MQWFGLHIYRYNYMYRHMYRYMVKYIYRYIDTRMHKYKYKFTYTYEQVPWDSGSNGAWRGKFTLQWFGLHIYRYKYMYRHMYRHGCKCMYRFGLHICQLLSN